MSIVVQKFGGSSVADAESVKRVAKRIVEYRQAGHEVVVVVSAMGDSTDDLIDLAQQVSPMPPARELDMLLTAGERSPASTCRTVTGRWRGSSLRPRRRTESCGSRAGRTRC